CGGQPVPVAGDSPCPLRGTARARCGGLAMPVAGDGLCPLMGTGNAPCGGLDVPFCGHSVFPSGFCPEKSLCPFSGTEVSPLPSPSSMATPSAPQEPSAQGKLAWV